MKTLKEMKESLNDSVILSQIDESLLQGGNVQSVSAECSSTGQSCGTVRGAVNQVLDWLGA